MNIGAPQLSIFRRLQWRPLRMSRVQILFIKFKQAVAILSLIAGNLSVLSVLPMLVLTRYSSLNVYAMKFHHCIL